MYSTAGKSDAICTILVVFKTFTSSVSCAVCTVVFQSAGGVPVPVSGGSVWLACGDLACQPQALPAVQEDGSSHTQTEGKSSHRHEK